MSPFCLLSDIVKSEFDSDVRPIGCAGESCHGMSAMARYRIPKQAGLFDRLLVMGGLFLTDVRIGAEPVRTLIMRVMK